MIIIDEFHHIWFCRKNIEIQNYFFIIKILSFSKNMKFNNYYSNIYECSLILKIIKFLKNSSKL